ncbi:MAG: class I SAM-dependent methyltransferase [Melioribacteraceae bacterium]|nr:class I SAM-dependent methyltransferase [Melioribacteraceae bacterium]
MKEWFKDWFASEEYLSVYQHRNESDAKIFFDLIFDNIQISEKAKVLDAACGAGRHAREFYKKGYNVFAFDLSKTLLNIASKYDDNINYFNCDIRNVPVKKLSFNLIVNIFTSFGYFETDEENFRFINNAYELLKDNGYFVFDYLNKDYVEQNLVPKSERMINEKKIIERRSIKNGRVHKDIIISDGIDKSEFFESVMLYSKDQLVNEFEKIGFKIKHVFGSYSGDTFNSKSDRVILICSK